MLGEIPHQVVDFPQCRREGAGTQPEYYVTGTAEDVRRNPDGFFEAQGRSGSYFVAHGKDPYFSGRVRHGAVTCAACCKLKHEFLLVESLLTFLLRLPSSPLSTSFPDADPYPESNTAFSSHDESLPYSTKVRSEKQEPYYVRIYALSRAFVKEGLERISDQATYRAPAEPSTGVQYLLVDGIPVVENGRILPDVAPGRPLKR